MNPGAGIHILTEGTRNRRGGAKALSAGARPGCSLGAKVTSETRGCWNQYMGHEWQHNTTEMKAVLKAKTERTLTHT